MMMQLATATTENANKTIPFTIITSSTKTLKTNLIAMQLLQQETLRERLITKESQNPLATRGSLSKCAIRMRDFATTVKSAERERERDNTSSSSTESPNETISALKNSGNHLIRELKLHDIEMKKMSLGARAADAELSYYDSIGETTQQSISNVREEIEKLRASLAHETKVRKNREEYEALAKMASDREPSRDTKRKLEVIQSEIKKVKCDTDTIQKKLHAKGKQFHLLLNCITDLKNGVDEGKTRDQVEKAAKQS